MSKEKKPNKIPVIVTYTEGYEERFTKAILKIYADRLRKEEKQQAAG